MTTPEKRILQMALELLRLTSQQRACCQFNERSDRHEIETQRGARRRMVCSGP
jgi:hypothetical protein